MTDSRRLTGANLFWDRPSAIVDVAIEGSPAAVIEAWRQWALRLLDAVGYADERTCHRIFDGGASLLISAPIDVLYSMCELNEVAWAGAAHDCGSGAKPDLEEEIPRLNRLFDEERNPRLLQLQLAAAESGVPFLWDDDEVSLGYGKTTQIWPPGKLPAPEEIDWDRFESIPVALVTGTNGKSTTVRMTASIMAAAGFNTGLTSTDFIRVGQRMIDRGDYSGTGGARTLMRQPDVEMAVLEVARGGLLRRGLGVEHANVAAITNVAADHLGDYGINTVAELIPAKFIVHRALGPEDTLVLNADDEGIVSHASGIDQRKAWFSLDESNPRLRASIEEGGTGCFLSEDWLVVSAGGESRKLINVSDIPATQGGLARYNISNALAAASIAVALGIPDHAICSGLGAFRGDEKDNPGRGNWFEHELHNGHRSGKVRILVDFAHNEHGMQALADTVRSVPSDRVVLLMGQAGDRLDKDIRDLVRAACSMQPDRLLVAELPGYERGRAPFEVQGVIRRAAIEFGIPKSAVKLFDNPGEATADALGDAQPGDLVVLLALTQRSEALDLVHRFLGDDG